MLSAREAAERLNCSMSHLRALRLRRDIPAQKIGRDFFYDEADVERVASLPPRPPGFPKGKTWADVGRAGRYTRSQPPPPKPRSKS